MIIVIIKRVKIRITIMQIDWSIVDLLKIKIKWILHVVLMTE